MENQLEFIAKRSANLEFKENFFLFPGKSDPESIFAKNLPLTKTELTKKIKPNRSIRSGGGDRFQTYKYRYL